MHPSCSEPVGRTTRSRCCSGMQGVPSADCGGMMLTAIDMLSYPFLPVLSIRLWRASIASRTNTSLRATWIAVGHCGRWSCCASADRRCLWSNTQEASRWIA